MSKKRGNQEGTIYKRKDGLWLGQISLPDGKRRSFYGKTRASVQERMAAAKSDLAKGLPLPDERQTLRSYLTSWLEGVASEIRPSTLRRYRDAVLLHLIPSLGNTALAKLSAQQVKGFYSQKVQSGLSPTTVHHIHGVLHRALKDALAMGLIAGNVSERVKAPRRAHKEMLTLTEEQARHFLGIAAEDRFAALYVLALTTGMREGELLALHWQDVDLDRGRLVVRFNVEESEVGFRLAETKTSYSRRTIGLAPHAIEALRAHRERQAEARLRLGPHWQEGDLVFPNRVGGLMIPDNLAKRSFKRLLKKAGLADMRFHDLRHTAATIAIARGAPIKVVSEMLGHADIAITLRLYGHVTPHMQQATIEVMERVFRPPDDELQ